MKRTNPITPQQYINLLDARFNMWPNVPPENVVGRLCTFRCDLDARRSKAPDCRTVACFGGWCAWWPAFRKQGVRCDIDGAPRLKDNNSPSAVSLMLFGGIYMFTAASSDEMAQVRFDLPDCEYDSHTVAHQVVMRRLDTALKQAFVEGLHKER